MWGYSTMLSDTRQSMPISLIGLSVLIALSVLAFDLSIPLGVAGGVPYVALVLLGSWYPRKFHVYILAAIGCVLTMVGYYLSPIAGGIEWMVLTNRGLAIFAILVTSVLVAKRKDTERELRELNENLESLVEDRTQEVRQREQRFRAVTESAQDAIISINGDGKIIQWNAAASKVFGHDRHDVIGRSIIIIIPERYRDAHSAGLARVVNGGERKLDGKPLELAAVKHDGSEFPIELSFASWEEDGEVFFTSIVRDVTVRKKAQQELQEALTQAKIADRTKTQLLENMTHELRTPLNAVMGFSETIKQEIHGPLGHEKYREYIQDITGSAQNLLAVINDILDVSALESGVLGLVDEVVEFDRLVEGATRLVQDRAERRNIKIEVEIDDGLPQFRVDPRRIKQVLANLLSNAVKFSHEGGVVRVSARLNQTDCPVVSVTDTGVGMNAEELEQAVLPFSQVGRGIVFQHEGTGLGLPLSKSLVELHGAVFEIESAKQEGTTVRMTFPKSRCL